MNIRIVHAHENKDSFCSALAHKAKNYLQGKGHQVTLSDLYGKNFNPVASRNDFNSASNQEYYKYALEQMHAQQNNGFHPQISSEMNALENADVLIFNFPLWWFGMPAILKGWVDKVLAYTFAYGGSYGLYKEGRFNGKRAFLTITTGSPKDFYTPEGMHGRTLDDILKNIHGGILELIGFETLPPFVGYGVSRISQEEREQIVRDYERYLDTYVFP